MGTAAEERYRAQLQDILIVPRGFRVAVGQLSFAVVEQGRQPHTMNIALVHSENPASSYAALTTTNRVMSPTVAYLRARAGRGALQTLVVNNKISNVGSQSGVACFSRIRTQVGRLLHVHPQLILSLSTGVIGWTLPIADMLTLFPALVERLGADTFVDFAQAIMTTDRFIKVRAVRCGDGVLLGACKGAGMVEPNLNTMLVFFFTDLVFSNRQLQRALRSAVGSSFARISVDGDQSTSDVVMMQSSNLITGGSERQFTASLTALAEQLALDVVRNGEGVGHLLRVTVSRARNRAEAAGLARFVMGSRLVGTAIAGNDPNVGRILARIGQYFGRSSRRAFSIQKLRLHIESQLVFARGHFMLTPATERTLSASLACKGWDSSVVGYPVVKPPVDIGIDVGAGAATATMYGGDLTAEYVHINADYRS